MANIRTIGIKDQKNNLPLVAEWIRQGIVIPPHGKKAPLPVSPVKIADGTARRLLRRSRDDTRV